MASLMEAMMAHHLGPPIGNPLSVPNVLSHGCNDGHSD